jgi:hypothetical protein
LKNIIIYSLFRKKPLKIIRGRRSGAERPRAVFTSGAAADRKVPNATAQFAARIIVKRQSKNFSNSEFKPTIQ